MKKGEKMFARTLLGGLLCLSLGQGAPARAQPLPAVDLARAEAIHLGRCFLCHGIEGESTSALYPRLAGQHSQYIARQLADFQAGRRTGDTMNAMADALTPDEMLALGVFFEQKPANGQPVADPGRAEAGRLLFEQGQPARDVVACASCHGPRGLGTERLPRLAGQVPEYIEAQLKAFEQGRRAHDSAAMHRVASKLSDVEIQAVALYLSGLD